MSVMRPRQIHGIALVCSGVVGAGMFSLPIVAAGMWFGWAVLVLAAVWFINYLALVLLLEANLLNTPGASFDTIVRNSLGDRWAAVNNLCIAFVMYILLYAYFSAGGSIFENTVQVFFGTDLALSKNAASVIFGLALALVVWSGSSWVSRLCVVLLIGMFASFALSNTNLLAQVELTQLLVNETESAAHFVWLTIPFFVAAFACSGIVPSLVKYYDADSTMVEKSLRYGTLLALLIYFLWLLACFGTLSREEMAPVIRSGGNTGDLVAALQAKRGSIEVLINVFSNFAIITSFLSVGLGLFDFMLDRFKLPNSMKGRTQAALFTFLPPALFSYLMPKGFVYAIGYAGLVVLFSFYLVPVMMALKNRKRESVMPYRVFGSVTVLSAVLVFAFVAAVLKILGAFQLLPAYP